jgi:hypothetical protein
MMPFLAFAVLGALGLLALVSIHIASLRKYTKVPLVGPRRTLLEKLTWRFEPFQVKWGEEGYRLYMAPGRKSSGLKSQAFRVPATYGYSTVLPPELLQEYARMDHDVVDFMAPPRDVSITAT